MCGVFGTQVLPGTDKIVVPLIGAFQKEVYDQMNNGGQKAEWEAEKKTETFQRQYELFQFVKASLTVSRNIRFDMDFAKFSR